MFNERFKAALSDACTGGFIRKRWGTVLKECSRFSNCVAIVKRNKPTGANTDDIVHLETAM